MSCNSNKRLFKAVHDVDVDEVILKGRCTRMCLDMIENNLKKRKTKNVNVRCSSVYRYLLLNVAKIVCKIINVWRGNLD